MNKRKVLENILISSIAALIILILGMVNPLNTFGSVYAEVKNNEKTVINKFNNTIAADNNLYNTLKYLNANIKSVSPQNAALMILKTEEFQKKYLPELEKKYYSNNSTIEYISKIYRRNMDINYAKSIKNKNARALLLETLQCGYKIETSEGFYYPIIDYGYYRKYISYLTKDAGAYVEIMAAESDRVPTNDAALVISWNEVIKRALNQESFINNYKNSLRIKEVKQLNKNYVTFIFYGANNTPLFSYDTKLIDSKANTALQNASKGSSQLAKDIKGFMELLKKNRYKLTKDIDNYRKKILLKYKVN